ncbi:hydantoinase B/oxoprolinase family protein [Halovivax limisalsi]|uniref:hydantoinase B/oxoprolinase family protein n=1 Tax=Halovivax limisalsi TaxID=1453760 RepID=UPI001FFDBC58|nr:hydantoinase B/oxoprolinase family protein [Halovivax limisalsi]
MSTEDTPGAAGGADESFDEITLGIYWDKLASFCDQMVNDLVRTAISPIIRESYDLSTLICDKHGNQVAQSTFTIPVFTKSMSEAASTIAEEYDEDSLQPGDVLISNDPWKPTTTHEYDMAMFRPIFVDGDLIGFTGTMAHLSDIGGNRFSPWAESNYEEGLTLPFTKLMRGGELNQELLDIVGANVRNPEEVISDIKACLFAHHTGSSLVTDFVEEADVDFQALCDQIVETARSSFVEEIREMPNGEYEEEMTVSGVDEDLTIAAKMTIEDERIHIDYEGTSPQIDYGLNVPALYAEAFTQYPIKCVTTPKITANEGDYMAVDVDMPEGSIFNPTKPAPISARQTLGHYASLIVLKLLAEVVPERVPADPGMVSVIQLYGESTPSEEFSVLHFSTGGFGARPTKDGLSATAAPTNINTAGIEAMEEKTNSLRYHHKRLWTDSGGDGTYRGGLGEEIEFESTAEGTVQVNLMCNTDTHPPEGLEGGDPGHVLETAVNGEPVAPLGQERLETGDRFTIRDAGGGGYGPPEERSPEAVRADVEKGYITAETAQSVYGVDVDE